MHYYRGAERCRWVSYLNSDETQARLGGLNIGADLYTTCFKSWNFSEAGAWNLNQRGGGEAAPAKWQVRCSRI